MAGGRATKSPGWGKVTAQEVAQLAGVSISAVSRAFTKGASVSAKMRVKVDSAAQALGYQPNQLARGLMTGRSELIGLVASTFRNPTFMQVFDLFTRRLQSLGLRPLLANLAGEGDAADALAMLRQYQVDAVIIATSTPPEGFAQACQHGGLPVIHVFGRKLARNPVPVITVDNIRGGALVAQAMIDAGIRSAAFIGGPHDSVASQDRLHGFRKAMEGAGRQVVSAVYAGDYAYGCGRDAANALLESRRDVEGIFCGDDIIALGVLDACRDRGLSVPRDISVVGFDDMDIAAWSPYRLTTVQQPVVAMVDEAIAQIAAHLENPASRLQSKVFPCELVIRNSLRLRPGRND